MLTYDLHLASRLPEASETEEGREGGAEGIILGAIPGTMQWGDWQRSSVLSCVLP